MTTGYIHSIETMGAVDGPGIRTVLFLQGCPARCMYCHNPDTWKTGTGKAYEAEQLIQCSKRFVPYYGEEGGVTFSGGEPLLQGKFLVESIKALKSAGVNSAIDTSGTYLDEYTEEAIENAQVILLDVKHTDPKMFKEITGRDQSTLLELIDIINAKNKPVWVRQVIVPGINDTEENVKNLNKFIQKINHVDKVELLGYHNMGESKWCSLGMDYKLEGTPNMEKDKLKQLSKLVKVPPHKDFEPELDIA